MNAVGKLMLNRKTAMSIDQIAHKLFISRSHARNSLTSQREVSSWLPSDKAIMCVKKKGVNKYRVVDF